MQQLKPSLSNISLALDRISTTVFQLRSFWAVKLQEFTSIIKDLFVPKIVEIEKSLDRELSDAIALAISDSAFRQRLIDRPKPTLASLDIYLPNSQSVTVLESTAAQTFLVLPMMTDREIEYLRSAVNSRKPQRAIRSQIMLRAWQDPDYKTRLLTEPNSTLIAAGLKLSAATKIKVLENTVNNLYLVIPTMHR